jgi:acetyltransferase-like isoleucine patch superfamily enzyme
MSGAAVVAAIGVSIGDYSLLGADVTIADTDFHPAAANGRRYAKLPDPKPTHVVTVGSNVFIGAGAYILKGVTIGDGAIVGAGSVVTSDVPPGQIYAGNPARRVGNGSTF